MLAVPDIRKSLILSVVINCSHQKVRRRH